MVRLLLRDGNHFVEGNAVGFGEEIVLADSLQRQIERRVIQQNGTEQGALGFQIVGYGSFTGGGAGHGLKSLAAIAEVIISIGKEPG